MVSVFALPLFVAGCASSGPHVCEGPNVVVYGARQPVVNDVCAGARAAFDFLAPLGLDLPRELKIDVLSTMPRDIGTEVAACYSMASHRVSLLRYDVFARHERWLGVPPQRELYQSIVTHEVTHAIVSCHVGERPLGLTAAEYVGNVAMFATMDPAMRDRVLAANLGSTGFDDEYQVTLLSYVFNQTAFGVDA